MPSRQVEQTFGLLIAYVFPGMIGLYAVGLYLPDVQSWFEAPGATELILMIIAASGVGVLLSVIRWVIYEETLLKRWFPTTAVEPRRRHDDSSEQALQGIIMQLYRYYQFSANTSVAVVGLYVAWMISVGGTGGLMVAGGLVALIVMVAVLGWSARESWDRDQKARRELYLGENENVQR